MLYVLKPFEKATKETSYLTCSVSVVIPISNALVCQLEKENEDDQGIKAMKCKLLAGLLPCYENTESNNFFAVASALDPRHKLRTYWKNQDIAAFTQRFRIRTPAKRSRVHSKSSLIACVEEMLEHSSDSEN